MFNAVVKPETEPKVKPSKRLAKILALRAAYLGRQGKRHPMARALARKLPHRSSRFKG